VVQQDVLRREAVHVLQAYLASGGPIYNPGQIKSQKEPEIFPQG
jgi:hypothetical protein